MILKLILILLGTVSLGLGILGVILPGLPTTPFLLLTAGLYIKSSPRLYYLLINHRFLGAPIRQYHANNGITKRARIVSNIMMWTMIIITIIFVVNNIWVKGILVLAGITGTIAVQRIPSARND